MTGDVIKGGFDQNPKFEEAVKRARKVITPDSPFIILHMAELGAVMDISPIPTLQLCHFSAMLQHQVTSMFDETIVDDE